MNQNPGKRANHEMNPKAKKQIQRKYQQKKSIQQIRSNQYRNQNQLYQSHVPNHYPPDQPLLQIRTFR